YSTSYTLSQADIDGHGANAVDLVADDKITNTATADSDQTAPLASSADTPVDYAPALSIAKTVTSVTDSNHNGKTDAGDVINYNVHVANTGDVTLTGLSVVDPLTGG